jgi:hypothetical protein
MKIAGQVIFLFFFVWSSIIVLITLISIGILMFKTTREFSRRIDEDLCNQTFEIIQPNKVKIGSSV